MLRYLRSRDGASAAEYAMLLGIIGGLVAIALFVFGGAVAEQMDSATATVASGGASQAATTDSASNGPARGGVSSASTSHGRGAAHANGGLGWGGGAGGGRGH